MGWAEVMEELERKLKGIRDGTYRPLDGIPFFQVQYPPQEEREALRQFALLKERLHHHGWDVRIFTLTEVLQKALCSLLNCSEEELSARLQALERGQDRTELQQSLAHSLPDELVKVLERRLREMPAGSVAILTRMGALYPFLRSSALLSRLEGKIACIIVAGYPGTNLGEMLGARPAGHFNGYYRGEAIAWK
ncbi:MAG: DUF1788 domain-containing protein [Anaerolineae bacterium]|nr:DUF1788 domain-containing protein [Anaerolineae bacterium]